jgi:hypothetical protein
VIFGFAVGVAACTEASPSTDRSASAPASPISSVSAPSTAAVPPSSARDAPPSSHASASPAPSTTISPRVAGACEDLVPGKTPAVRAPTLPPHLADRALGFDTSTPAPMKTLANAGFAFAYVQAAIGLQKNAAFRASFDMASRCGLPRGAYQFISQGVDGHTLAKTFLEVVGDDPGELAPTLDLERPPSCKDECCEEPCGVWSARVDAWLDEVETATKRPAMVYLVEPFFTKCICASPRWRSRPLWLAAWPLFDFPKKPRVGGFDRWAIYQFEGNVLRFGGVVDLDVLGEGGLAPFTR